MKMIPRSYTIFLSTFYLFCFLYHLFFQYFTFSPLLSILRTSEYNQEFYFENNLGGLLWECEQREKVIFYFNDWNGNCSTRIGYIRQLQKNFPNYFIIQLEYPGYGYSSHLDLSIYEMIDKCGECIQNYIKKNNIQSFGLWGEGMGNIILSKIIKEYHLEPDFILHYNLTPSIYNYINDKYSILSFLFFITNIHIEDYSSYFKEKIPTIYLLYNKEKNYKKYTNQYYYNLKKIPFSKKNIISFDGIGKSSFFLENNLLKLQKILV